MNTTHKDLNPLNKIAKNIKELDIQGGGGGSTDSLVHTYELKLGDPTSEDYNGMQWDIEDGGELFSQINQDYTKDGTSAIYQLLIDGGLLQLVHTPDSQLFYGYAYTNEGSLSITVSNQHISVRLQYSQPQSINVEIDRDHFDRGIGVQTKGGNLEGVDAIKALFEYISEVEDRSRINLHLVDKNLILTQVSCINQYDCCVEGHYNGNPITLYVNITPSSETYIIYGLPERLFYNGSNLYVDKQCTTIATVNNYTSMITTSRGAGIKFNLNLTVDDLVTSNSYSFTNWEVNDIPDDLGVCCTVLATDSDTMYTIRIGITQGDAIYIRALDLIP